MTYFDEYQNTRRFASLNGIRCLCIIGVFWHHSVSIPGLPNLFKLGFLGVDMFFVLSGYLIVTLVLREKRKTGHFSLFHFYARRALRIFPVYYGTLLAVTLMYLVFRSGDESATVLFQTLPYYLTFTSNWSVVQAANLSIFWSLATEEQFYLVWPFLERFITSKWLYLVLGGLIFLNQLINFGVLDSAFDALIGEGASQQLSILGATFTPICLGVALAHTLHNKWSFELYYRIFGGYLPSALIFAALFIFLSFTHGDIAGLPRLLIQLLMCFWLGSVVINQKHFLKRFLNIRIIDRLGEISYGAYIFHMLIFHFAREAIHKLNVSLGGLELFLIGGTLVMIIAELSFRFYEQPFLKFKSRFS
ncbi:peptidoglycan/LPS O-acetylase OafA/YrhL [Alteromonadaceae bacterium 2753L.S.0a.02]|nr:peptidoglycan/LPS O-acetylase OafA/YrhL [Alteromonadaceae bacterium 2753L.S.0a.02]